jgi:rhamnosyltransferase subunit B
LQGKCGGGSPLRADHSGSGGDFPGKCRRIRHGCAFIFAVDAGESISHAEPDGGILPTVQILIFALGSAGDVHPFLGIGRALKARGHEVILVASGFFEQTVLAAGLDFRALGSAEDYERLCSHPDLWHPRRSLKAVLKDATEPTYPRILEIVRELQVPGERVMVGSSLAFGARNARELFGIPLVTVHLAPALFPSLFRQPVIHEMPFGQAAPRVLRHLQWQLAGRLVDHLVLPGLNRFRDSHGLPPARRLLHDWWHSPDLTLGLFPDWFAAPQPDWPPQTVLTGFPLFDEKGLRPLPEGLGEFLDAGPPPVIFTPGSAMNSCAAFFQEAVGALRLSGRRGILLTRFAGQVPAELPRGVRHFSFIPFSEVLPRAAALVYHGGVGSCAQALQAGVPHLVQPMAHDQHDNLSRVRELGVGDGLPPRSFKAASIARCLDSLIDSPSVKQAAVALARRIQPARWMDQTCALIEGARLRA